MSRTDYKNEKMKLNGREKIGLKLMQCGLIMEFSLHLTLKIVLKKTTNVCCSDSLTQQGMFLPLLSVTILILCFL